MTNILVTGGAGHLGRPTVTKLVEMGHTVRIMSRRRQTTQLLPGTQWIQADLTSGQGIAEATADIDVIIHTATDPLRSRQIDVDGTQLLMAKAHDSGVKHVIYISIVGIDRIPFSYYLHKRAAEKIIEYAGMPWTILRATQFHSLVDLLLLTMTKLPLAAVIPSDFRAQTIDESEVAGRLCEMVEAGPQGRLPDLGGPEVLTLQEMTKTWLKQRAMQRAILPLWIPGTVAQGFRSGYNTCPEEPLHGNVTWDTWLRRHYHPTEKEQTISDTNGGEAHAPTI